MKGSCKHDASALDPDGPWEKHKGITGPGVSLANDEDGFYYTIFEAEVRAFIAEVEAAAKEAFGEEAE